MNKFITIIAIPCILGGCAVSTVESSTDPGLSVESGGGVCNLPSGDVGCADESFSWALEGSEAVPSNLHNCRQDACPAGGVCFVKTTTGKGFNGGDFLWGTCTGAKTVGVPLHTGKHFCAYTDQGHDYVTATDWCAPGSTCTVPGTHPVTGTCLAVN